MTNTKPQEDIPSVFNSSNKDNKKRLGRTCGCPNGRSNEGKISLEVENHEIGCRFRDRLKKMKFEYIPILDSCNTGGSFSSLTSTRRVLIF
jgi:hypothetical protein